MRVAISVPQRFADGTFDPQSFRRFLGRAEALGFESAWTQEQVLGRFPQLGPTETLTFAAACTEHIRLGCAVYVTPLGNAPFLRAAGLDDDKIVELDWWQSHRVGALEITAVPARHWSMRAPWNRNDALWGGFVFRGPEGAAYHSGDTALFDGFAEIGERAGPLDWAMLPIGAYEPRWFMEPQHMNPEDAGQAFERLGARRLVAMHWGTFKLTDEPLGEPPARIVRYFQERHLDPERLWLLDIGETRPL